MLVENLYLQNTLTYDPALCNGCRMCTDVCPHAVFKMQDKKAVLANASACMECGACELNCEVNALHVESGVGCASAMFLQAIKGEKLGECGGNDCGF